MVIPHKVTPCLFLKSPSPSPSSPRVVSICFCSLPCGPVLVVADEMRLNLKRAMQGGVVLTLMASLPPTPRSPTLSVFPSHLSHNCIIFFIFFSTMSFHQHVWSRRQKAKVHLTTECNSKVNHS